MWAIEFNEGEGGEGNKKGKVRGRRGEGKGWEE